MKNSKVVFSISALLVFLFGIIPVGAQGQTGLFLSRNGDFSSEDRTYNANDVLFVKVVAPSIDFTDIDKNEFRLKPDEGGNDIEHALTNHLDGVYTTQVDLGQVDGGEDDWEVRVRIEDDSGREFRARVNITIEEGAVDDGDDTGEEEDDNNGDGDEDNNEVEFAGIITDIEEEFITVGERIFRVDANTEVLDSDNNQADLSQLSVGQLVQVKGIRQADGTILAVWIKIESRDGDEVELTGEIESIEDRRLVVAGFTFFVADNAVILDNNDQPITLADLSPGLVVQIRAEVQTDGSLLATDIKIEDRQGGAAGARGPDGRGITQPREFELNQNYPNPFNPATTISFEVVGADRAIVSLTIHNILGQTIRTLFTGELSGGRYELEWGGRNDLGKQLASGTYLYRLRVNREVQTKSMVLMQ